MARDQRLEKSWNDNYNAGCKARQLLRNAAEQKAFELPTSPPANHDRVRMLTFDGLYEHFRRVSTPVMVSIFDAP